MIEHSKFVRNNLEKAISFLLLLFLPTQFGKHFWPSFAFVLGQRIDYLSPTLYFTDVLILILFVVWISERSTFHRFIHKKLPGLFLAVSIFLFLNIFFSKIPVLGWYYLLKAGEFTFFGWYIAHFFKHNTEACLYALATGVIFESSLGVIQYVHQGSLNGLFYFFGERMYSASTPGIANTSINGHLILRPYGTFPHPNVLAGYLVVVMTLLLALSVKRKPLSSDSLNADLQFMRKNSSGAGSSFQLLPKRYIKRWFQFKAGIASVRVSIASAYIFGTIALLLLLSRIAILVWFSFLVFLFFKRFLKIIIRKHLFLPLVIILGFTIFTASFLLPMVFSRFITTSLSDESVVLRETLAKDAVAMMIRYPVFGVGVHNFLVALPGFSKTPVTVFTVQPVHNLFLLIGAETGIVGLFLSVWFVFLIYKRLVDAYRPASPEQKDVLWCMFFMVSEMLFLGQFDHYFLTIQQGQMLLALVLGLILAKKNNHM